MKSFLTAVTVAALAATAIAPAGPASAADNSGFRIQPYLQNPSSDGMLITWFSETSEPGVLTVSGQGSEGTKSFTSNPEHQPLLDYTQAELDQKIAGLQQGSWLYGNSNYKHQIRVEGLAAGATYAYSVRQGSATASETFKTAPAGQDWKNIRFVAMADSETEPAGRVTNREWAPGSLAEGSLPRPSSDPGSAWDQANGTQNFSGQRILRYMMTEDQGYKENLKVVEDRDPDMVLMPGDLVQGGGYQAAWDEFFRHNAGENSTVLSRRPILPALGNWENFGGFNGGYGTATDRSPVVTARQKYHTYFNPNPNGTPEHDGNYHRQDYGPVTIITLDSSNGEPDDAPGNYPAAAKVKDQQYNGPGTDTQDNFTRAQYEAAGGTDLADFNPGSQQWNWAEQQLKDARERGQMVFVQFHHAPYSSGEHGTGMDHVLTTGQGGTPMRQYHPMFEKYGVAAVLSGHSEMFERSFVDGDGDGKGVQYYDVGVSGDGLRGEKRNGNLNNGLLNYNRNSQWSADQSEPERWELVDGVPQLVQGGKHYGHLEINIQRLAPEQAQEQGKGKAPAAKITFTPVHVFPILDSSYELETTERRVYNDEVVLFLDEAGKVVKTEAEASK